MRPCGLILPFHLMVADRGAPVVDEEAHEKGLEPKEPLSCPETMVAYFPRTAAAPLREASVRQFDNAACNGERPPALRRDGEGGRERDSPRERTGDLLPCRGRAAPGLLLRLRRRRRTQTDKYCAGDGKSDRRPQDAASTFMQPRRGPTTPIEDRRSASLSVEHGDPRPLALPLDYMQYSGSGSAQPATLSEGNDTWAPDLIGADGQVACHRGERVGIRPAGTAMLKAIGRPARPGRGARLLERIAAEADATAVAGAVVTAGPTAGRGWCRG